eukprot:CAMPEP_0201945626 /NCGR_PEP_ID=MMETSP0903-20130614/54000_1 /ASSEMBLY_ACC=CAM_ASM_000552 /TAXON_ID=420261 /ORGANISM="Thalassiosira antarctica, Strain CCMP982" /LENGTH=359 /DNA_ID=CAMNT_0048488697 /DNA_START=47 /DNA_END=1126 /DNA_ORIENTATION=-
MTATAVISAASSFPYVVVSATDSPISVAQKRRRDDEVGSGEDDFVTPKMAKVDSMAPHPLAVAPPIVTVRKTEGAKRPQMKYDPSVPMTKEETSAWRREQRRKRNRESAAACRKRQRDRISELEDEVSGWKAKFDDALRQFKGVDGVGAMELEAELESMLPIAPPFKSDRCSTPPNFPEATTSMTIPSQGPMESHMVSPYDRPKFTPPLVTSSMKVEDIRFPFLEDPLLMANPQGTIATADSITSRVENRQHLKEIITRPAVKITGAVNPPLDNIESVCDDLLQVVPESCLSLMEKKTMPFPKTCPSLVASSSLAGPAIASLMSTTTSIATEDIPNISTDESDEDSDLGEFLLDAVQWL